MDSDRLYTGPHQVILDQWISCAPFEKLLGLNIVEAKDGRSYLTMPFLYHLAQGQGMAHGGAVVTLADTAVAMAIKSILPPDSRFGTISLNAEFMGPVTKGVLSARAEVTPLENRQVQGQAVVSDEDGRQVMRFSAMFKLGREVKIATHT
ncbi:MAG: PaaI family thioesterase [Desulfotignum sp.]|nr:PaaI family thioesterase [Desulfotignum sp.]MCF8125519.1 PaaI family thioesterase [Desulfotignum sp.]